MNAHPVPASPLLLRFQTNDHRYVFCGDTNRIFHLTPIQNQILEYFPRETDKAIVEILKSRFEPKEVISALSEMNAMQAEQKAFNSGGLDKRLNKKSAQEFEKELKSGLTSICLEVTQACNFRCTYCAFSGGYEYNRSHGSKAMDWKTAKTAIDFLHHRHYGAKESDFIRLEDSVNEGMYNIGFYGGEPLLHFDFIKRCVEYAESLDWEQPERLSFNMTTNASLLTDEMIDYFVNHKVCLLISLDGPELEHDRSRRYANGDPTFDKVYSAIERLSRKVEQQRINNPDYIGFGINCVMTPGCDLVALYDFFTELSREKLTGGHLILSDVSDGNEDYFKNNPVHPHRKQQLQILYNRYFDRVMHGFDLSKPENIFLEQLIGRQFLYIQRRSLTRHYIKNAHFSAMCTPGKRKPFVDVEGNIHACERLPTTIPLGNVFTGFDYQRIAELWNQYTEIMNGEDCRTCFAVRHCSLCFSPFVKGNKLVEDEKKQLCENIRNGLADRLITFCAICEKEKDAFKYMDSYVFA